MAVLITGFLSAILLTLGCAVGADLRGNVDRMPDGHVQASGDGSKTYDAAPLDLVIDPRRTKVQLYLDKDNPNDVQFVDSLTDVLKDYRDVKLEKEHIALRNDDVPNDEAVRLVAESLARLLDSPRSNLVIEAADSPSSPPLAARDHHSARCSH